MRKKALLLILSLAFPGVIFAGSYNDVTLTTSVSIVAGGKTYNISSVSAVLDTLTVNLSNFSFVLDHGSSIRIQSADGTQMTFADQSTVNIVENICNSSGGSIIQLTGKTDPATITVTPTTTACSGSSSSSAPAGAVAASSLSPNTGSGNPPVTPVIANTPSPNITPLSGGNSGMFIGITLTKRLHKGSRGKEVENLQKFLMTDPELYPGGQVTGYYGVATQKAVQKFQEKYLIAKKGKAGYGEIGPATRAKLNLLMKGTLIPDSTATSSNNNTPTSLQTQIASLLKMVADLSAQIKAQGH